MYFSEQKQKMIIHRAIETKNWKNIFTQQFPWLLLGNLEQFFLKGSKLRNPSAVYQQFLNTINSTWFLFFFTQNLDSNASYFLE